MAKLPACFQAFTEKSGERLQVKWKRRFGSCKLECVAVKRMLLGSSDVGVGLCLWGDTSSRLCPVRRSKSSPVSTGVEVFQSRKQEEGAAFGSAVDPAEGSHAIGGSFGSKEGEIPAPQQTGHALVTVLDPRGEKETKTTIKWR